MRKCYVIALVLCICLLFVSVPTDADFGDFSGGNDWGGGSDWGGSDWGDSDWGSSGYNGGGFYFFGNTCGDSDGSPILFIIILAIVVLSIMSKAKKWSWPTAQRVQVNSHKGLTPIGNYSALDPNFDSADFTQRISNQYVQMQNCWQAKDLSPLRPYLSDAFFAQADRQLDTYRNNNQTNMIERIAVLSVTLDGYYQESGNDHIVATIKARIVDYTVDDKTGAIVRGDKNREKFMTYEWTFVRPSGKISSETGGTKVINCPNCSAPVDINMSTKCPYCDSIITVSDHDFVLNGIKGISQVTQ